MRPALDDRVPETRPIRDYISTAENAPTCGIVHLAEHRPVRQRDASRPLIFTHVPKTSGIALRSALIEALAPCRVAVGIDAFLLGDFTPLEGIDEAIGRDIIRHRDELPANADLVMGHMAYSTPSAVYRRGQHVIVLREPFTRLMSHYVYWRSCSAIELSRWGCWGEAI